MHQGIISGVHAGGKSALAGIHLLAVNSLCLCVLLLPPLGGSTHCWLLGLGVGYALSRATGHGATHRRRWQRPGLDRAFGCFLLNRLRFG
jgi:hypothetical protein